MNERKDMLIKGIEFGDLLLSRRKEKEISLQKLSHLVNGEITPSYINRLEKKEKSKPSFEVVCQLSQALELNLEDVFNSFGYHSLYQSQQPDIVVTQNGNCIVGEIKKYDKNNPIEFDRIFHLVGEYSSAEEGKQYGYLPEIMKSIEDVRKKQVHQTV